MLAAATKTNMIAWHQNTCVDIHAAWNSISCSDELYCPHPQANNTPAAAWQAAHALPDACSLRWQPGTEFALLCNYKLLKGGLDC